MKKFFVFIALFCIPNGLALLHAQDRQEYQKVISAESLVQGYVKGLEEFDKIIYDVDVVMELTMGGQLVSTNTVGEKGFLDFSGKKYYSLSKQASKFDSQVDSKIAENLQKEGFSIYCEKNSENEEYSYVSSTINPSSDWVSFLRFQYIAFFLGYLNLSEKNVSIVELLGNGQITLEPMSSESNTYSLFSTTDEAQIKLNFLLVDEKVLLSEINYQYFASDSDLKELSFAVTKRHPNGLPSEYNFQQTFSKTHRSGIEIPAKIAKSVVKIPRIEKKESLTDSEFSLSTPIKNGTSIFMRDAPQIGYIWYDGKIVPKTDELMLAIARGGHKFIPGPKEPRFWFMSIGLALFLFACGFKAYRYFQNTGAPT